ncbi:unnamed protein product, partial [Staurois parvus]
MTAGTGSDIGSSRLDSGHGSPGIRSFGLNSEAPCHLARQGHQVNWHDSRHRVIRYRIVWLDSRHRVTRYDSGHWVTRHQCHLARQRAHRVIWQGRWAPSHQVRQAGS